MRPFPLLVLFALVPGLAGAACTPPSEGNWTVDPGQECSKGFETLNVNGSLIVRGTLTLNSVTLWMNNSTADGQHEINITSGGRLTAVSTTVNATNTSLRYAFRAYGNLTLQDSTVLHPYGDTSAAPFPGGIQVYASGAWLERVAVLNSGSHGLYAAAPNTTLLGSNLSYNALYGAYLEGANGSRVEGTVFRNQSFGVYITQSPNVTLADLNASFHTAYGVYGELSENITLQNVTAAHNSVGGAHLFSDTNGTVSRSRFHGGTSHGLFLRSSSGFNVSDTTTTSNSIYGFYLRGVTATALVNDTATGNSQSGFYLFNSPGNTLTDANGSANAGSGLFLQSSQDTVFLRPVARSNGGNGLHLLTSSNATLTGADLRQNSAGAYLDGSNANLAGSTLQDNTAYAIQAFASDITLENSTLAGSGGSYTDVSLTSNATLTSINSTFNAPGAALADSSYLDISWHLTLLTTSSSTPTSANVTVRDQTAEVYNGSTDSAGSLHLTLAEYRRNATAQTNRTPHTINATKANHTALSQNITMNQTGSLTLALTPTTTTTNDTITITTTTGGGGGGAPPATAATSAPGALPPATAAPGQPFSAAAGQPVIVSTGDPDLYEVSFQAGAPISAGRLLFQEAPGPPAGSPPPPGRVYRYFDLQLDGAQAGGRGEVTFRFRVPKTWLAQQGADPDQVVLYRHTPQGWETLGATLTRDEGTHYRYESTSPGLSTFAIGLAPKPTPTPGPGLRLLLPPVRELAQAATNPSNPLPWLAIGSVAALAIWLWRRRR